MDVEVHVVKYAGIPTLFTTDAQRSLAFHRKNRKNTKDAKPRPGPPKNLWWVGWLGFLCALRVLPV
jgi:hypothetical protein